MNVMVNCCILNSTKEFEKVFLNLKFIIFNLKQRENERKRKKIFLINLLPSINIVFQHKLLKTTGTLKQEHVRDLGILGSYIHFKLL